MKYILLHCEDRARDTDHVITLLEGARVSHLQQLAQAGCAGMLRYHPQGSGGGQLDLHRALFGLKPSDRDAAPGHCYAASAKVPLGAEDTAWCCELMTQQEGQIIDPTAGNISTRESRSLLQALNQHLGSATRRWELGEGSHHLLIITRDAALEPDGSVVVRAPELLVGKAWRHCLPKGPLGEAVRELIEQAVQILETHAVNRVRVDLGENPANALWLWGWARGEPVRTFTERHGLSGVILSSEFVVQGFAKAFGLGWLAAPDSFDVEALRRLREEIQALISTHDVVYVHLTIESDQPVERLCAMERIDQVVLKPLTELLPQAEPWRLLVAVDNRRTGTVPFVAMGEGLSQQPVALLDEQHLAESPLVFHDGAELFSWWTTR